MNTEVLAAFDKLLEAISREKTHLAEAVKEATLNGQFAKAQRLLAQTERVEQLMEQVRQLRDIWEKIHKVGDSSVTGLEPSNIRSETKSGGTEYSPELGLVEQLFDEFHRSRRGKRQAVNKTPQHAYRIPILEALEQLGGRASMRDVLNLVYEKMKDRLTEDDLKPLSSGGDIRWANTAQWERYNMVREGLLKSDSPRGVWEITEVGRAYLEQARQQGAGGRRP